MCSLCDCNNNLHSAYYKLLFKYCVFFCCWCNEKQHILISSYVLKLNGTICKWGHNNSLYFKLILMYSFESHIIYKPFPDIMCYNGRFILCPPTDFHFILFCWPFNCLQVNESISDKGNENWNQIQGNRHWKMFA